MKTKIFLLSALLTAGLSAQAQNEQMVQASSYNKVAELPLQNNPKLIIGAKELLFTDGTNRTTFSADEKVVLRVMSYDMETRVETPKRNVANGEETILSIDGKHLRQLQRGVNIIHGRDGSIKKVLVK